MKFYHFSDTNINNGWLDPKYFGKNSYTKHSTSIDDTPRLYFYDTPKAQECYTKGKHYRYTINIPVELLIDCYVYPPARAKKRNYLGICSNDDSPWQGCSIFQRVKIFEKTDLWEQKQNAT